MSDVYDYGENDRIKSKISVFNRSRGAIGPKPTIKIPSIQNFTDFVKSQKNSVDVLKVFSSVPNKEYEEVFNSFHNGHSEYRIYVKPSPVTTKNPMDHFDKVKFFRKMFPRFARNILSLKDDILSDEEIANMLKDDGYSIVTIHDLNCVNENRIMEEYSKNIAQIERTEERIFNLVKNDNLREFMREMPKSFAFGRELFEYLHTRIKAVSNKKKSRGSNSSSNSHQLLSDPAIIANTMKSNSDAGIVGAITNHSGISESNKSSFEGFTVKNSGTENNIREKYIAGDLFKVGDTVISEGDHKTGKITVLGTNYVIIKTENGDTQRKWIKDIKKKS
jgi:hypothetical protein